MQNFIITGYYHFYALYVYFCIKYWSSLFYYTSARHEQHECNTNDTSATRTLRVWLEWDMSDTSATRTTWVRHKCYTNDTSVIRIKNFDFHNDTSENIFWHPYISCMQMKDCKERSNIILRTTFWECLVPMSKCVWKVQCKNRIL